MRRKLRLGKCPICGLPYGKSKNRRRTKHHIFPKWWYVDSLTVFACSECHQREFHYLYPMEYNKQWSAYTCVQNWVKFCQSKGKDAYRIYPELKPFKPD